MPKNATPKDTPDTRALIVALLGELAKAHRECDERTARFRKISEQIFGDGCFQALRDTPAATLELHVLAESIDKMSPFSGYMGSSYSQHPIDLIDAGILTTLGRHTGRYQCPHGHLLVEAIRDAIHMLDDDEDGAA